MNGRIGSLLAPPLWPDPALLLAALALLGLGLTMVGSASMPLAGQLTGNPSHFLLRQCLFAVVGLGAAWVVYRHLPMDLWDQAGPLLLLLALVLLVAVLIPGVGREVNGSSRWLPLGPVNLQVSELAKLLGLVYLAGYVRRYAHELPHSSRRVLLALVPLGLMAGLILLEPDLGGTAVIGVMAVAVLFLCGARLLPLVALGLGGLAVGIEAIRQSPYRMERLQSFLDPWADPTGAGYQLVQSLIAIGRGEVTGVGLGASVQKAFFLPEAHTDFIFAILAEELGLIGVIVLIGLYGILVGRCFAIGRAAERQLRPFEAALAYGVGVWLGLQTLINLGVNMGVLPTKGLTLPLVSYGGSSLVVTCVALALVLRVDVEVRAQRSARTGHRTRLPKLPSPGRSLVPTNGGGGR